MLIKVPCRLASLQFVPFIHSGGACIVPSGTASMFCCSNHRLCLVFHEPLLSVSRKRTSVFWHFSPSRRAAHVDGGMSERGVEGVAFLGTLRHWS